MIRLYTGNILNKDMENDFRRECPYIHELLCQQTLRKKSVRKAMCDICSIEFEHLKNADINSNLSCGDFDYGIVAELLEVPNRNKDGSRAALRYSHPFYKHPVSIRRRFFDFAVKMSVGRDIDISFISNSSEFVDSIVHALETNVIQRGGVEIKCYTIDGCRTYGFDDIIEDSSFGTFDIFI